MVHHHSCTCTECAEAAAAWKGEGARRRGQQLAWGRESQHRRRRANPDEIRRDNLRRSYGLTLADYEALRAAQDHRCAICRRHEDELPVHRGGRPRADGTVSREPAKLVVDHCHNGGGNRGLLCHGCNAALGLMGEDLDRLRFAIEYLQRWSAPLSPGLSP